MDIAFPAVLLFLIVAPGFIFREFNQRRDVRASEATPLSRATFSALLAALFINGMVCWLVSCFGYYVQLWDIYNLIVQPEVPAPALLTAWQRLLSLHWLRPVAYFALTCVGALLAGKLWMALVECYGMERQNHCLSWLARGDAPWLYLLEGLDHDAQVDSVWLAATIDLGCGVYLYQGLLSDYELAEDGKLDRVVLSEASRCAVSQACSQQAPDEPNCYEIQGDRLVLQYDRMTSLSIRYVTL